MGFDIVELVMDCEEKFGVTVTDKEAEKSETPNMLCDLVFSKLTPTDKPTCQSQKAFYILRRALDEHTDARRADILPDMEIRPFLSADDARELWPVLKASAEARSWPALERPRWLRRCLWGLGCGVVPLVFFGLNIKPWWIRALLVIPALIAVLTPAFRLTRDMKKLVPARFQLVKDLVPYAVTSDQIKWTRPQVADMIKKIILNMIDEPDDVYRENASFLTYYAGWSTL